MTRKIFEEDVMQRECHAVVMECSPYKDGFAIWLDQTVFFPEGGGQLSDVGWLETSEGRVPVRHVRTIEGDIVHEVPEEIAAGTAVLARLDWEQRFDHMQQHCGEHLLSYAFWKLYGANNVGFHMNRDVVTIDLDQEFTPEEVAEAEWLANEHVQADGKVTVREVSVAEAAELTNRKLNEDLAGPVRVVSIEGSDACTCCGTHPPRTGLVGLVKVLKSKHHKGGTRVFFLCGRLALEALGIRMEALGRAAQLLSLKEEEIADGVERLIEKNKELKRKLRELQEQGGQR